MRSNIKSILVKTGLGGTDAKYKSKADYVVDNLYEAVNIILETKKR